MGEKEMFSLTQVTNSHSRKEFLELPVHLYKNEPNWIRPIDLDIENIFNPLVNKHHNRGESIRWILKNYSGETIGRIAAFYDESLYETGEIPVGGVGFFECINDRQASFVLFETAKKWLESRNLEGMDGPVNFGIRDNFWGCLVEGFHEPLYNMPYNFPYYKDLFESFGFKNYFNQYTYQCKIQGGGLHPLIRRSAERVLKNPDYQFKLIEKGNVSFARDFRIIYNKTWSNFTGTSEVTEEEAIQLLKKIEPVLDTRLVIYGYYKGEPIAFFVMIPDIGQLTKKFNGKLNWWKKLQFLWNLKVSHKVDRVIGRIFGVVPEHQGKGVEGALVITFENEVLKPGFPPYNSLELNWIGDFNPVMMKMSELIGGSIYKTHVTYRYLFDQSKEFHRAPLVNTTRQPKKSNPQTHSAITTV
jgi:GNAT superfamily N-acetyltransferase